MLLLRGENRLSNKRLQLAVLGTLSVVTLLALILAALSAFQHDYRAYLLHWDRMAGGGVPWGGFDQPNAYGPVNFLFAFPYMVHPVLPRILFASFWMIGASLTLLLILKAQPRRGELALSIALLLLNPLVWIFVCLYGVHDSFVAVCCAAAFLFSKQKRTGLGGFLLALAAGFKFYPALLLPFLARSARGIDRRMIISFSATLLACFAAAYAVWGKSVWFPVEFAIGRESKLLSIFTYLEGPYSPVNLRAMEITPAAIALPAMVVCYLAGLYLDYSFSLSMPAKVCAALLVPLSLYQLGQFQFFIPLTFLLPLAVFADPSICPRRSLYLTVVSLPLAWVAVMAGLYWLLDRFLGRFSYIRGIIGLPSFAVILLTIAALAWLEVETKRQEKGSCN